MRLRRERPPDMGMPARICHGLPRSHLTRRDTGAHMAALDSARSSAMTLYRFDDFQLDPQARRLLRAGRETSIEPRVFDLVVYLIEQRERAVGRDELIAGAWGRVDGSDGTLAQAILKARRLLGDDGHAQRVIRTVARFGYQWVAATAEERRAAPGSVVADERSRRDEGADAAHVAALAPAAQPATRVATGRAPLSRKTAFLRALAAAAFVAVLAIGAAWYGRGAPSARHEQRVAPGLVAVLPANVHSAVAQDGWMRLGLMAMSADALRALPQHAVVPSETVLAAAGNDDAAATAHVRASTGAATIVHIDARREHERWQLEATLEHADGRRQSIGVEAADAVAAGAALGQRLRTAIGSAGRVESGESPEALAVGAHMQAELLEGHAAQALALADAADAATAASPRLQLLRAKAMNRLGRAAEAAANVRALIARAQDRSAPWLSEAWTTLGYGELVAGRRGDAEQAFRQAIALLDGDRIEAGRAWRGLGNAQAAGEKFDDAEASYLRARLELEGSGDRLLLAHLLDDLGSVAGRRGRFDEAITRYGEAADAAAAIGSDEVELGARMNVALAQLERLQNSAALRSWQALLPRLRAVEYPSMRRFAAIHYADALAETGALAQAGAELDRVAADMSGSGDALEDARLDILRVRALLGDWRPLAGDARAIRSAADATPSRRVVAAAIELEAALGEGDDAAADAAAAALEADIAGSGSVARARALSALAAWHVHHGDAAQANRAFGEALALVRANGSPRDLRDVAVAYAGFQLDRGEVDAARATASLVGPYADDDFPITLLLSRVAAAGHDTEAAARLRRQAQALAHARWAGVLRAETAAPAASAGPTAISQR